MMICENIEVNLQVILNFHVQTLSNFTRRMPFDVPFDVLGLELPFSIIPSVGAEGAEAACLVLEGGPMKLRTTGRRISP